MSISEDPIHQSAREFWERCVRDRMGMSPSETPEAIVEFANSLMKGWLQRPIPDKESYLAVCLPSEVQG